MKIRNIMKTKNFKEFVMEVGLDLTNETKTQIIDKVINENKSPEELKRAAETIGLDLTKNLSNRINIIFLDVDGVLRTHKSDLEWSNQLNTPLLKGVNRLFSKSAVDNLNEVIILTKAKIVVTSTWRINLSVEELNKIFKERGVIGEVIDKTGINFGGRGLEIKEWLDNNSVTNYVVLDDQVKDIVDEVDNVIKVDSQNGFEEVDLVLDILL